MSGIDVSQYAQAAVARDQALRQVEEHADVGWLDLAYEAVVNTAHEYPEFISDDVWASTSLEPPRELRALGPVFRRAVRDGIIVKTDRMRPSVRSHLSGKPIWRSLVYDPENDRER